jgi:hypothetical protein
MADEPVGTSPNYDPKLTYTPPVGQLPVLGKIRAEIDRLHAATANDRNTVINRDLAQIDSNAKITAEIANENTRTIDNTRKVDSEVTAQLARTSNEDDKTVAEITALDIQSTNDSTKTANDTTRTNNDTNRSISDIANNNEKTDAEVALLDQKRETELAQVSDLVATGTVAGVIGKQKGLFQKQTDGFDRDAEQKLSKIMVDTWSVRQTTDGADAGLAGLAEASVAEVLSKAKLGINII